MLIILFFADSSFFLLPSAISLLPSSIFPLPSSMAKMVRKNMKSIIQRNVDFLYAVMLYDL